MSVSQTGSELEEKHLSMGLQFCVHAHHATSGIRKTCWSAVSAAGVHTHKTLPRNKTTNQRKDNGEFGCTLTQQFLCSLGADKRQRESSAAHSMRSLGRAEEFARALWQSLRRSLTKQKGQQRLLALHVSKERGPASSGLCPLTGDIFFYPRGLSTVWQEF